jgi:hypothetical protein
MLRKNQRIPLLLILYLALGWSMTYAQESVNAGGGDASGSTGTVAYSMGQVLYTVDNGTTGSVSKGVQHPFEIYVTGVGDSEFKMSLSVYPNPTTSSLTLQIEDFKEEKLMYQLFDTKGTLLSSAQINQSSTDINTSELAQATYMLYVVSKENKTIQSYKIVKH